MEYPGSSVVIIRQILSRILRFDHMSRSLSVSESLLVRQDPLVLALNYFFVQILNCSFCGGGS